MAERTLKRASPRTREPAGDMELRADRRSRALHESLDIHPRQDLPFPAVEVRNPVHRTHYLVAVPAAPSLEGALCQCSDFARRGLGTCKHIEAVRLWLREHSLPARVPDPHRTTWASRTWAEVDRRIHELEADSGPKAQRIRRPGDALIVADPG